MISEEKRRSHEWRFFLKVYFLYLLKTYRNPTEELG